MGKVRPPGWATDVNKSTSTLSWLTSFTNGVWPRTRPKHARSATCLCLPAPAHQPSPPRRRTLSQSSPPQELRGFGDFFNLFPRRPDSLRVYLASFAGPAHNLSRLHAVGQRARHAVRVWLRSYSILWDQLLEDDGRALRGAGVGLRMRGGSSGCAGQ